MNKDELDTRIKCFSEEGMFSSDIAKKMKNLGIWGIVTANIHKELNAEI